MAKVSKKAAPKRPSAKDKLADYRAMRDFKKTSEPSGAKKVAPSKHLRFVIQKHAATRLHYDFRLELDGVFKSWAVTRGPSLDPREKRLAVQTEDHPLDYGDFEGTIPKDEYGGGTVMLWDRGFWAPEPGTDPEAGIKKGDFKFVVAGEKINGSFVLVRMKRREKEKRDNWLLIKHRDDYAKEGDGENVLKNDKSVASGRTLDDIKAGKGKQPTPFMAKRQFAADDVWHSNKPRGNAKVFPSRTAGFQPAASSKTQTAKDEARTPAGNRRSEGAKLRDYPQFIPPQFCRSLDKPPSGGNWVHEIKFDGYRMQLRVRDGRAKLLTRTGLDWTEKFEPIARAGLRLGDCILDGEVCAIDESNAPDFSALQAAISDGDTSRLIFFAFDLLCAGEEDVRGLRLEDRKARLRTLLAGSPPNLRYVEHFEADGAAVLEAVRKMGLEGIVSKNLNGAYKPGKREDWAKIKARLGHEVVIGGWSAEGERFRSLLVGVNHGGHLVYTGRVGTGFTQTTAQQVAAKLKKLEQKESPFGGADAPKRERGVHWVKPELVAEIEFAGWSDQGAVRQGAFKGLREDKRAKDVVAEEAMKAKAAKLKPLTTTERASPARVMKSSDRADVMGVSLSHPDKPLWPQPEITKLDLAHYFEAVGEHMLAHIKRRPCSIIRAPDGIDKELFFQRHPMKGASDLITQIKTRGEKEAYIQFDSVEAIVAGAQISAIEFHPWNCQPGHPEIPGRFIFDLDPDPGVNFDDVIAAAREMKQRLEALGLVAFCKTTGGKGLHVVTPLKMNKDLRWPEAKAFCQEVCRQMAADSPDKYLINMSKKQRAGKIFLDYLRNDATATAVAPYSPRARQGAHVSMPIAWSQVRAGLDPAKYNLRSAPALIRKSRAWDGYGDGERAFFPAAKKLVAQSGR
ncbi:MAG: DNA ligase D [Hyphomonadaceae bacterium]|nr:DNA ligase D [Hyphomonadaceae bacterium]